MNALLLAAVLAINPPDPALRSDIHLLDLNHYNNNCHCTQIILWDHRGWIIDWLPWQEEYAPCNPLFVEHKGAYRMIVARKAVETWTPGYDPEVLARKELRVEWRKGLKRLRRE